MSRAQNHPLTLAIDIGGTGIKMMVLDIKGSPVTKYFREPTPIPATFEAVSQKVVNMISTLMSQFDRISVGFPGVVRNGMIKTAPNMHPSWIGIDFQRHLQDLTHVPTRVANDADVQGYGDISDRGVELVITLGTGMGSALFVEGKLVPNLELGHHPFLNNKTYEEFLGKDAFENDGVEKWNEALKQAIFFWELTFNYDTLYLGGGLAHHINITLPNSVKIGENIQGVLGGMKLWEN